MSLRTKNIIYSTVLLAAMFAVWKFRSSSPKPNLVVVTGRTMGPIVYNVKYFDKSNINYKKEIDSLLVAFNESLNTYQPASEISQFNKSTSFMFGAPYFKEALEVSKKMYETTQGAFDPSIGQLINAWGFGNKELSKADSAVIDSLRVFSGFGKIKFDETRVWKDDERVQIDFSASAKGYGVDVVVDFLKENGIDNLYVEIGGEVRAIGKNLQSGKPWKIGIIHPNSTEINIMPYAYVSLIDKSMATSGNYFNYHVVDGVKYGHTIDPVSGYPIQHSLLSASVFAANCHEADALATAFMVMGHEKAIQFLNDNAQYDAYLIFSTPEGNMSTYATSGITAQIEPI